MLKPLTQYFRYEVGANLKGIVISYEVLFSIVAGIVAVFLFGFEGKVNRYLVDTVMGPILTYATISFGFCISGLSIILSTNPTVTTIMANSKLKEKKGNAYSCLLFIFSWTAVAHWVLILFLLLTLATYSKMDISKPLYLFILSATVSYCLCMFLVVLLTISQYGRVVMKTLGNTDQ